MYNLEQIATEKDERRRRFVAPLILSPPASILNSLGVHLRSTNRSRLRQEISLDPGGRKMPAFITRTCPQCRKILWSASGSNLPNFGPPRVMCGHCGTLFNTGLSITPTGIDYYYLVGPYGFILMLWIVWFDILAAKNAFFWIVTIGFTIYLSVIGMKNYSGFQRYKKQLDALAGQIPTWR